MAVDEVYAQFVNGSGEKYKLEDSTYLIPTNLDRAGLSKMINELLNLESPVLFDIVMNDQRLRGTVSERMEECNIESESSITLVYLLAVTEPAQTRVDNFDDWISGLSVDHNSGLAAVCSYNGKVSVYRSNSMSKALEFSTEWSKSSVHLCTNTSYGYVSELICGNYNGQIEVYNLNTNVDNAFNNLVATNDGFSDTVTSIVTDESTKVIVSGGYNSLITVYENVDLTTVYDKSVSSKTKKRPVNEKAVIPELGHLQFHTKLVTKLKFSPKNPYSLLSSSMDGNVCLWDLNEMSLVSSHLTLKPVTCFAISPHGTEMCTGSLDGTLVIWDLRSEDSSLKVNTSTESDLKMNKLSSARPFQLLASDVAWNPTQNLLSATGFDGKVLLADIRSPKYPLQETPCDSNDLSDRGTCTAWMSTSDVIYTTSSGLVNTLNYKELSD